MCLYSKTNTPLIAEEDIVVYKVLMHRNGKDYAPVVSDTANLQSYIYKKGANKARLKEDISLTLDGRTYAIGQGFLHAYTTNEEAEKSKTRWNCCFLTVSNFVVKMIVPKGTEYFVGIDEKDICAKQLIWEDMTPCEKPVK